MKFNKLIMLVSFVIPAFLTAQNDVTFRVDMRNYSGSFSTVEVGGSFNQWCGNCAFLEDPDGDDIYELTVSGVPSGDIEFKFHVDNWSSQELFTGDESCVISINNGEFVNRIENISGNTTLPVYCFNSCNDCSGPKETARVNFRVDMSRYTGSFNDVNLEGTFNGFCGGCAIMEDPDGDMIYELLIPVPTDTIEYKYAVDSFSDEEQLDQNSPCVKVTIDGANTFVNRVLAPQNDTTLEAVCWGECVDCVTAGVTDEELSQSVSVFPNPANGNFTIDLSGAAYTVDRITLVDVLGKVVLQETVNVGTPQQRFDVAQLESGVYFVRFHSEERTGVQQIVINN